MELRPFDPHNASRQELEALHRFATTIQLEQKPDDAPQPFDAFVAGIRNIIPIYQLVTWLLWDGDRVVGRGEPGILTTGENEHIAQVDISVLPDYRRQGLGTDLLRVATDWSKERKRTLLMFPSWTSVPAGEGFLKRIGAEPALNQVMNELRLDEVDRGLLQTWIKRAEERASGFRLELQEGPWPEEKLPEVAAMMDLGNLVPHQDLQIEDMHLTPDAVRQMDESWVARGMTHWTILARETATGKIAGFTDITFDEAQPEKVEQDLTAVFPEYQGKGLGRWLKAAMLEKILTERPQARKVTTGNADTNESMLSINHELGFRPAISIIIWQAPVETVEAYLATSGDTALA